MSRRSEEVRAKVAMWLARRASRDTGLLDRLCRQMLGRALSQPELDAAMRDDWVDGDLGFDADELERYQRGES